MKIVLLALAFAYGCSPAPLHPWKILKMERRAYAVMESERGGWPSMEMRHALRVVKDEYVDKWRDLAYD